MSPRKAKTKSVTVTPEAEVKQVQIETYTSRSATENGRKCRRSRFWGYEFGRGLEIVGEDGKKIKHPGGLATVKASMYLLTGSGFHNGVEGYLTFIKANPWMEKLILQCAQRVPLDKGQEWVALWDCKEFEQLMDSVVAGALKEYWRDFDRFGLITYNYPDMEAAGDLSSLSAEDRAVVEQGMAEQKEVMDWTAKEQAALVEGMIRGWGYVRLPELLVEYEILEVEQEGEFVLNQFEVEPGVELVQLFQYQPDVVIKHKVTGLVEIVSTKTAGQMNWAKMMSAKYAPQLLSEAFGWTNAQRAKGGDGEVYGVRMEYAMKGRRMRDKRVGNKVTYSPLIRGWKAVNEGMVSGEVNMAYAWSWSVPKVRKNGEEYMGKLSAKLYSPFYAWEDGEVDEDGIAKGYPGGVKAWVKALAMGQVQEECGNALEELFFSPESYQVDPQKMWSWFTQAQAREKAVAQGSYDARRAIEEGDSARFFRILDEQFDQSGEACVYMQHLCPMIPICHGDEHVKASPLDSGLYRLRSPHHDESYGDE